MTEKRRGIHLLYKQDPVAADELVVAHREEYGGGESHEQERGPPGRAHGATLADSARPTVGPSTAAPTSRRTGATVGPAGRR